MIKNNLSNAYSFFANIKSKKSHLIDRSKKRTAVTSVTASEWLKAVNASKKSWD